MEQDKQNRLSYNIFLLVLTIIVGLTSYCFFSGEFIYVETFSAPGESRGYIGRKSKILESENHFAEVWNKLENSKKFKGKEISFKSINIQRESINVILQDPENADYYDYYYYNGNKFFNPRWKKDRPYKKSVFDEADFRMKDLNIRGMYKFYTKVTDYLEGKNLKLTEDDRIHISVSWSMDESEGIILKANYSGEREDFSFESNVDGDEFEVK